MKKYFFTIAALLLSALAFAGDNNGGNIPPSVKEIVIHPTNTGDLHNPLPKSPVQVPWVGQLDYTLYFPDEVDFTVNLYSVDEDENLTLEYTTFVPSTTESIMLPSNLSGSYAIEVIRGEQHFEGEIEL